MNVKIAGISPLVLGLMAAGTAMLLAIVLSAAWLASTTADLSAKVVAARQIRISASEVLETLLDAETGQRGYLLSADERYLAPFDRAEATIARDLENLGRLEQDNPAIRSDLVKLQRLSTRKMAELHRTVMLARGGHRGEALAVVRTGQGIRVMDGARTILKDIIGDSERIVSANLNALNRDSRLLRGISLAGGVMVLFFAGLAIWLTARALREAEHARGEVEQLNGQLEDRVLRRTAALTRANDEIQRFAYIVSHDLRAPLVNIMGFTSEMEVGSRTLAAYFDGETEDGRAAAKQAATQDLPEAVKFIRSSTGKMDRLINAILKLSREGRRELMPERVDLNKVFEALTDSLKHQVEETATAVELSGKMPVIQSDRLALEQVFGNLFDNALKYLQPGRPGRIAVWSENARNAVTVVVKDNGRGIAETDRERVFELFRRAGRQDRPGEGIGLAHVRALVRRLGGDITVVSQLGEGSEFRVVLPRTLSLETGATAS